MGSVDIDAEPLTDDEVDRLTRFLRVPPTSRALTLEGMDGFFCAVIAGPTPVRPGQAIRRVLDDELPFEEAFAGPEEATDIVPLMLRHWNAIAAELERGDAHVPFVVEPGLDGIVGRDWARGFMQGCVSLPTGGRRCSPPRTKGSCS
jgi:uncharacterized protein